MRTISIYVLVLFILTVGCKKSDKEEAPAVAAVGKSYLTIADLKSMLPQSDGLELSVVQVQNFVQRWTEKELVYQHAVAQGFLQKPEIQRKLRDFERDYIYAIYIQQVVEDRIAVSEEEVVAYYNEHPDEFIRQETQYDLQLLMVNTYTTANECADRINGGEDFGTVARENSLDESKSREGRIGWSNLSGLPDDVRRRVPTLSPRIVSQPIQTPIGFYVVQVLGVRPRGEKQSLDEARDLITWKIKTYKREDEYKELIRQLKDNVQVTNHWELLDMLEISK